MYLQNCIDIKERLKAKPSEKPVNPTAESYIQTMQTMFKIVRKFSIYIRLHKKKFSFIATLFYLIFFLLKYKK